MADHRQGCKPVQLGFYNIERTIGRGNYAVVKLARHRVTKSEVKCEKNLQSAVILIIDSTCRFAGKAEKFKLQRKDFSIGTVPVLCMLLKHCTVFG